MNAIARERQYHNPLVEQQRRGFCVYNPKAPTHVFVQYYGPGCYLPIWGEPKTAKVYDTWTAANAAATMLGGVVTTVPRHNGHGREWEIITDTEAR